MNWQNESGHTDGVDMTLLKYTVISKGPPKPELFLWSTNRVS